MANIYRLSNVPAAIPYNLQAFIIFSRFLPFQRRHLLELTKNPKLSKLNFRQSWIVGNWNFNAGSNYDGMRALSDRHSIFLVEIYSIYIRSQRIRWDFLKHLLCLRFLIFLSFRMRPRMKSVAIFK